MKAKLVPIYFGSGMDENYRIQIKNINSLLSDVADIAQPLLLGSEPPEADAAVFPQLSPEIFNRIDELRRIGLPFLVVSNEFGTIDMWDWELISYMKSEGLEVFAPYNIDHTRETCKSLALKKEMKKTKFLVYQDNPGSSGLEGEIFRLFFWWEEKYARLLKEKFGVGIVKKSFKELGVQAREIPDSQAKKVIKDWKINVEGVSDKALSSAAKIYLKVKGEIEKDPAIKGAGINCLNESFYSETTPCLAWNMLYEEKRIIWACEADTLSLLTTYVVNKTLDVPIMMSNVYPFLIGSKALKNEKIDRFPEVQEPENHLLVVHCGYFGLVPQSFCTEWTLRPKVLEMVNDNATAIDARMPRGPITIVKIDPTLTKLVAVEAEIVDYVQYPGSDCRNGALVKVKDGHKFMDALNSHHNCLVCGHRLPELRIMADVFGLNITEI